MRKAKLPLTPKNSALKKTRTKKSSRDSKLSEFNREISVKNSTTSKSLKSEKKVPESASSQTAVKSPSAFRKTLKKINPIPLIRVWLFNLRNLFGSQKFKVLVAGLATILIVGGFVYLTENGFPGQDKSGDTEKNQVAKALKNNAEFQRNVEKLKNVRNTLTPDSLIYDKVKYEDLPIYPISWVERNFSQTELRNALISGPAADPDGDGLSNKAEFLFGSNPKNKFSLCGSDAGESKCSKTDKQNVDAGISPLTGFPLETNREIKISKQDQVITESIQNSFENASNEGVDFPSLYQESSLVDYSKDLNEITFLSVADTRNSFTDYVNIRISILEKFLAEDEFDSELGSLLVVYKTSKVEELDKLFKKYDDLYKELKNVAVPESYTKSHRALLLLFQKLLDLVDYRKSGVSQNILENSDYKARSKQKAVAVVWGYRQMNDELIKITEANS